MGYLKQIIQKSKFIVVHRKNANVANKIKNNDKKRKRSMDDSDIGVPPMIDSLNLHKNEETNMNEHQQSDNKSASLSSMSSSIECNGNSNGRKPPLIVRSVPPKHENDEIK